MYDVLMIELNKNCRYALTIYKYAIISALIFTLVITSLFKKANEKYRVGRAGFEQVIICYLQFIYCADVVISHMERIVSHAILLVSICTYLGTRLDIATISHIMSETALLMSVHHCRKILHLCTYVYLLYQHHWHEGVGNAANNAHIFINKQFSMQVSLQDGLQRTIKYFREELSRTTFANNQTYIDVKTKS